jgi:hypothetical protein
MSTAPVTAMTTFLPITLLQRARRRFGAAFVATVVSVIAVLLNSFPWHQPKPFGRASRVPAHPVPLHLKHQPNYGNFLIF